MSPDKPSLPSLTQSMEMVSTLNVPLKMWSIVICLFPPLPA